MCRHSELLLTVGMVRDWLSVLCRKSFVFADKYADTSLNQPSDCANCNERPDETSYRIAIDSPNYNWNKSPDESSYQIPIQSAYESSIQSSN